MFEGEGSVSYHRSRAFVYVFLSLESTDEDSVRRFGEIVGGSVRGPYERVPFFGSKKPYWSWSVSGRKAEALLAEHGFIRHLGMRRRGQIARVLGMATAPAKRLRKTHCTHGHKFTKANTYHWRGHRACRRCARERQARRRALDKSPAERGGR